MLIRENTGERINNKISKGDRNTKDQFNPGIFNEARYQ